MYYVLDPLWLGRGASSRMFITARVLHELMGLSRHGEALEAYPPTLQSFHNDGRIGTVLTKTYNRAPPSKQARGAKTASVVAWWRAAGADGGDGDSHGGGGGGGSTRTDTRDERSVPSGVASGSTVAAVGGRSSCMRVFQYYVMECRCCAYAKARLRVCHRRVAEPLGIRTRFGIRDQTRGGLGFERDCRTN